MDESREVLRQAHSCATEEFDFAVDLVHLAGRLALSRGDKAKGERGLRAAFEEEPDIPGHGRVLAEFLAAEGREDEAAVVAMRTLQAFPDDELLQRLASHSA